MFSIRALFLKTKVLGNWLLITRRWFPMIRTELFSINKSTILQLLKSVFTSLDLLQVGLKIKCNSKKCKEYYCFGCEQNAIMSENDH